MWLRKQTFLLIYYPNHSAENTLPPNSNHSASFLSRSVCLLCHSEVPFRWDRLVLSPLFPEKQTVQSKTHNFHPILQSCPLANVSVCLGEDVGLGKRKGDEERIREEGGWGGGCTVGVMRFGGLAVRYSEGLSYRWHPFGWINQHTYSGSDWIWHPSYEHRHPSVWATHEGLGRMTRGRTNYIGRSKTWNCNSCNSHIFW